MHAARGDGAMNTQEKSLETRQRILWSVEGTKKGRGTIVWTQLRRVMDSLRVHASGRGRCVLLRYRTYHRLAKLRNIDMHCTGNIHALCVTNAAAVAGFFGNLTRYFEKHARNENLPAWLRVASPRARLDAT